ncbi:hypothetical protein CO654_32515 [Rhizobium sp. L18]|nr:hypothetical protein CO654_32515 [Rhizobium sp. L18]
MMDECCERRRKIMRRHDTMIIGSGGEKQLKEVTVSAANNETPTSRFPSPVAQSNRQNRHRVASVIPFFDQRLHQEAPRRIVPGCR